MGKDGSLRTRASESCIRGVHLVAYGGLHMHARLLSFDALLMLIVIFPVLTTDVTLCSWSM